MDSPEHCAQYCTYTRMEKDSTKIVAMEKLDKRETGIKSTIMEKLEFRRSLYDVKSIVNVQEWVTDAHLLIGALMSEL